MRNLLLTATALGFAAIASPAGATLITAMAQESLTNTVTATDNAVTTTINIPAGTLVTLGGGEFNVSGASMELTATSVDTAVNNGGIIQQHYSGSFCVSSIAGCGGNFLSGTFTDAAFGANGGAGLVVQVSNPPENLVLTSNVIPASELLPPSSFNLTFVNLGPALHIDGGTIGAFTASFTGDVSANSVPEPRTIALFGVGLLGLGTLTAMRKRR